MYLIKCIVILLNSENRSSQFKIEEQKFNNIFALSL